MNSRKLAVIDMGSNSIRLVINAIDKNGHYKELHNLKVVARLSNHFDQEGNITNEGISVIIDTLKKFHDLLSFHRIDQVKAVATAAIRKAVNQQKILTQIHTETNINVTVLSEYQEAYYGYLAIVNSTNIQNGVSIDIGGGSTEISLFTNRNLVHYHSFPFGAITLQQMFFKNDPPSDEERQQLTTFLNDQFSQLPWLTNCAYPVVGIGGSARNLSLIQQRRENYPLAGLHQYQLSPENMSDMAELLSSCTLSERQRIAGLSKDRADIIIPAVEAISILMKKTSAPTFILSNKGLRDGLFYEELLQQIGIERFPNVAEESFYQLTHSYEINIEHIKQVSKIVRTLYHQLQPYLGLEENEEPIRLLQYSARVLYIGEYINPEASSQHTFYLLTHTAIDGLSHEERLAIAFISSFKSRSYLQHFAKSYRTLISGNQLKQFEILGSMLKLAYSLNRTRRNLVKDINVTTYKENEFNIYVFYDQDGTIHFEQEQAVKYKKHLEKALKCTIHLQFQAVASKKLRNYIN
ncbi:exopolyphosphatase [Desertibacillus haloalkaliphilus]|uniref:exopolyphosphatase n=1 Tax=Desertibacillus haloalkaliphilus TaxID=1328930 RepID=UPI001C280DA9|nr:exopolyphosphatase [Desertibacillus haloalkaliphilus]MBU8905695.1 exopolyphosphatase [Desertibacillus haloalkaliphilus]